MRLPKTKQWSVHSLKFLSLLILIFPWLTAFFRSRQGNFVFPSYSGDEDYYLIRARSYWEGANLVGYLNSNSPDKSTTISGLFEYLTYAKLGRKMSFIVSFEQFVIVTAILSITITYFVTLTSLKKILQSDLHAVICALFTLIGIEFIEIVMQGRNDFLTIARFPFPVIHYLVFFYLLNIIFSSWRKSNQFVLFSMFTLMVFSYFYSWQILFLTYGITLILQFKGLNKNERISRIICYLAMSGSVCLYVVQYSRQISLEHKSNQPNLFDFMIEKISTNSPSFSKSAILLVIVSLYIGLRKNRFEINERVLIYTGTIGTILFENQQVILGFQIQPGHFRWYFTNLFLGMACFLAIRPFLEKYWFTNKIALNAVLILVFISLIPLSSTNENFTKIQTISTADRNKFLSTNYASMNARLIQTGQSTYWHNFSVFAGSTYAEAIRSTLILAIWEYNPKTSEEISQSLLHCKSSDDPCATLLILAGAKSGLPLREFNGSRDGSVLKFKKIVIQEIESYIGRTWNNPNFETLFINEMKENKVTQYVTSGIPKKHQINFARDICSNGIEVAQSIINCR